MQNIITKTFKAGEKLTTGAASLLLVRDCSHTIGFKAQKKHVIITPVELKKNDVVSVGGFDVVELFNHHDIDVTVKYQLSDVPINTQSDAVSVTGAVEVNSIKEPVNVGNFPSKQDVDVKNFPAIQKVGFDGEQPVSVGNFPAKQDVDVKNFPAIQKVSFDGEQSINVGNFPSKQDVDVKNFPAVQKVQIENHQATQEVTQKPTTCTGLGDIALDGTVQSIAENTNRKSVIIQANEANVAVCLVMGLRLMAGGVLTLPASNAISIQGAAGDSLQVVEVV